MDETGGEVERVFERKTVIWFDDEGSWRSMDEIVG